MLAMVLDPVGSLKLQEGANGNADIDTLLHRKVTRIWVRRFRWFFCWLIRDEHSHEAFSQAAGEWSLFNLNKCRKKDSIFGDGPRGP